MFSARLTRRTCAIALLLGSIVPCVGADDGGKYHVTAREKLACISDATRLCSWTYPDEDKLIGCMKENMTQLTGSCRTVFQAGLRRRGL